MDRESWRTAVRDLVTGARVGIHVGGLSAGEVRAWHATMGRLLDDAAASVQDGYGWRDGVGLVVDVSSVTLHRRLGTTDGHGSLPDAFAAALLTSVAVKPGGVT